ncbi:MAG: hypothetical protein AAF989_16720 [Planctomycetota bacterium]
MSATTDGVIARKQIYDAMLRQQHPMFLLQDPKTIARKVRFAKYGLGHIDVIDDADPFPGSVQFWMALHDQRRGSLQSVPSNDTHWVDRVGYNFDLGNENFWRWLIAAVGGPPVKSFLFLNFLFCAITGPLASTFLRRRGRLYLLYFFAPVFALVVTSSLFCYAFFGEGVDTKLRTIQWTWVDGINRTRTHQDRTTLYAAFGSGEMRFSHDTLVTPISPTGYQKGLYPRSSNFAIEPHGRVRWTDDDQIWDGSFLPTRTQVQFQGFEPILDTPAPVTFQTRTDGEKAPREARVTNHTDTAIRSLFFRDRSGILHGLQSVAPETTETMTPASQMEVEKAMAWALDVSDTNFLRIQSGRSANAAPAGLPILESRLRSWVTQLPRGHFIGLTSPMSKRIVVDSPSLEDSLQVIMGVAP